MELIYQIYTGLAQPHESAAIIVEYKIETSN